MFNGFDLGAITQSLSYLFLQGMKITLSLTLFASLGGLVLGTLIALARMSSLRPIALLAASYVNLMRSLPLVLVIFWFYFLMPFIVAWLTGATRPVPIGGFLSALITFTLFEAAYFSEIMRAGIQSIPQGQLSAGYALGLNYRQVMITVVLPQALRNMLPVLLTQTIILFQDTSLVYVLSLTDFLGAASKIAQRDGRIVELYLFAALIYFVFSFVASALVRRLQARSQVVR
jgi:glutamate/aspartate transport system permease protein